MEGRSTQASRANQALLALTVSLWLGLGQAGNGQGRPAGDPLERRVPDMQVEALDVPDALAQIACEYDIPIGVEMASKGAGRGIKLNIPGGTLRDVPDAVAEQDPGYEWNEQEGVVNFVPPPGRVDQ